MSTYMAMWQKIKELTDEELDTWIDTISPARGIEVDFLDVKCIDIDLLNALRNHQESDRR